MRPLLSYAFLCVFWGVTVTGAGFCAFCDQVRTIFMAFGTFLVALFWEFGVVEKQFDQNSDVYTF